MSSLNTVPAYLSKQIEHFFPDGQSPTQTEIAKVHEVVTGRLRRCFTEISNKYYAGPIENIFSVLHGDHYAMYLYLAGRAAYEHVGNENLAAKCFLLNKALHGIDAFYKIKLPEIFLFVHPVGTILGNAEYADFFCVYQGCTVGSKLDMGYPKFHGPAIMYSNSSLIGDCQIGKFAVLGAGASLVDEKVADEETVFGLFPANSRKKTNPVCFEQLFHTTK